MATNANPDSVYRRKLGWLLYVLALLLIAGPLSEWLVIVLPVYRTAPQWRFSAIGLLGDRLTTPVVGVFTAMLAASLLEHRAIRALLGWLSFLVAAVMALLAVSLLLDGLQIRGAVAQDVVPGFDRSLIRTLLLLAYAAVVGAVLGWAALKARGERRPGPRDKTPLLVGEHRAQKSGV